MQSFKSSLQFVDTFTVSHIPVNICNIVYFFFLSRAQFHGYTYSKLSTLTKTEQFLSL